MATTVVAVSAYNNAQRAREPVQPDGPRVHGANGCGHAQAVDRRGARPAGDRQLPQHRLLRYRRARTRRRSRCRWTIHARRCRFHSARAQTDADNHGTAKIAALYVQDEIALSAHWQVVLGLRYDQFDVDFDNHRTGDNVQHQRRLVIAAAGPGLQTDRAAVALRKLFEVVPAARRRTAVLTVAHQRSSRSGGVRQLRDRCEVGCVAESCASLQPCSGWTATTSRCADPNDPTRLDPGRRSTHQGHRAGVHGQLTDAWSIVGSYAYQDGELADDQSATLLKGATLAQRARKYVLALESLRLYARRGVSAWDRLSRMRSLRPRRTWSRRTSNVTLPDYTRVDAAVSSTSTIDCEHS